MVLQTEWMFCVTNKDDWLRFKLDRAESNRDTWFCREDLTVASKDSQCSNSDINSSTGVDVIQVTKANRGDEFCESQVWALRSS
jgi:hypothetical protein